jgi:ABC-type multidrug transport system permease subunit
MSQKNYEEVKLNLKILLVLQLLQILLFVSSIIMIILDYSFYIVICFLMIFIYTHYEMNNIRGELFENA